MEKRIAEQMNEWRNQTKEFEGVRPLYWAGILSYVAMRLTAGSNILRLMSYNLELLDRVRREYDNSIMTESGLSKDTKEAFVEFVEKYNKHVNVTPFNADLKPPAAPCNGECACKAKVGE
jgi:hypothetical protein